MKKKKIKPWHIKYVEEKMKKKRINIIDLFTEVKLKGEMIEFRCNFPMSSLVDASFTHPLDSLP